MQRLEAGCQLVRYYDVDVKCEDVAETHDLEGMPYQRKLVRFEDMDSVSCGLTSHPGPLHGGVQPGSAHYVQGIARVLMAGGFQIARATQLVPYLTSGVGGPRC